jgi:hypothetical protein
MMSERMMEDAMSRFATSDQGQRACHEQQTKNRTPHLVASQV